MSSRPLQQAAHQILCLWFEPVARRRQGDPVGRAVEQAGADPVFQCADAPAERRLGQVAGLGRAVEVAGVDQGQEIFEPGKFH